MAGSEHHKDVTSGQAHETPDSSAQLDHSENLQGIEDSQENKEKERKRSITALVAFGLIVFTGAVLVVFFALQTYEETDTPQGATIEGEAPVIAEGQSEHIENYDLTDGIIVARQTDYIFYNANLDDDFQVVDPTVGAHVDAEGEEDLQFPSGTETTAEPEPEPEPALTAQQRATQALGTNFRNLLGIDVLDAQAMAQAAGFVVHQVFVVDPSAVTEGATPPRPGQVIDIQTYRMRSDGQHYMFLHVQTTEPTRNAQRVPDLDGVQWRTGAQRLRDTGLGPRYVYERNSPNTHGVVIYQAPPPGAFTPRNSTVIMVLADRP